MVKMFHMMERLNIMEELDLQICSQQNVMEEDTKNNEKVFFFILNCKYYYFIFEKYNL